MIKRFLSEHSFQTLLFFSGILFGTLVPQIHTIELEGKLTISDILSICVTIWVGLFVATTIASTQTSDRFEKELLIGDLTKIRSYNLIDISFESGSSYSIKDVAKAFKNLNIMIIDFEQTLAVAKSCSHIQINNLRSAFKNYRQAVTSLPHIDFMVTPSRQEMNKIQNASLEFRKKAFELVCEINSNN